MDNKKTPYYVWNPWSDSVLQPRPIDDQDFIYDSEEYDEDDDEDITEE